MGNTTISVLVRCWYDRETDTTRLRIRRTDTAVAGPIEDNSLLFAYSGSTVVRCVIRHIASGVKPMQGGPRLVAFINEAVYWNGIKPEHDDLDETES